MKSYFKFEVNQVHQNVSLFSLDIFATLAIWQKLASDQQQYLASLEKIVKVGLKQHVINSAKSSQSFKKIFSRVVNINLKIFKMSRYFTEENDGGMSAEVFTISKDDTNHASKIRSSVMREKGKEFKRSKNELFYAKKKNKAKCSNRLKVLKVRQVVGI